MSREGKVNLHVVCTVQYSTVQYSTPNGIFYPE